MTIPKSKTMQHIIDLDGLTFVVSEHVKPNMGGMIHKFANYEYNDGYEMEIHKIATCPTPGSFVYMYQLVSLTTGESDFIIVNNKKYYDDNGYFDVIIYDEFMDADNTLDAYREFAKLIESEF